MKARRHPTETQGTERGKAPGFTLIELLVVISVIALLMALLLPVLHRARNQARKVVCQVNLRHFGTVMHMYIEENEGRLSVGGTGEVMWLLRGSRPNEYRDPEDPDIGQPVGMGRAACCPMAVKPSRSEYFSRGGAGLDPSGRFQRVEVRQGSTFEAWVITRPGPEFRASYGFNSWPFTPHFYDGGFLPGGISPRARRRSRGLKFDTIKNRSQVPILLDSARDGATPGLHTDGPIRDSSGSLWFPYCINRHNGRVNGLFLDGSVREVGLKELWTLPWCPKFDTAGPRTLAGGARPEDWPEWMRGMKDY